MKAARITAVLLLMLCVSAAWAQQMDQKPAAPAASQAQSAPPSPSVSTVLNRQLSGVEQEFVSAADAMPEDKYGYAPTAGEFKGVRTFALQVRHVATASYMIGAAIVGEKPPVDTSTENGSDSLKTKAQIMQYLRDSFAYLHNALDKVTPANQTEWIQSPFGPGRTTRLAMGVTAVAHPFDHYGQMVEYLRSNGIIPPASRGQ